MTHEHVIEPPPTGVAVAVGVAVAATISAVAATVTSAHAIPDRLESQAAVARSVPAPQRYLERPCFITPAVWNEALDGPLPRCRTRLP